MKLHPRLTRATAELVRRFETFQPEAERTSDGGWSIGYGHTRSARPGAEVSAADAEALLLFDLDASAHVVERALFAPVTQRQFEALTAFCFNIGEAAFLRSSALARLNAGAELDAADEIERWRRAELGNGPQVVDALVRRRAAEKAHFLGLPEGAAKSPSARLRPLAAEGGETFEAEPALGAAASLATSATLSAADEVQARLRRLIPEAAADEAPPFASAPSTASPDIAVASVPPLSYAPDMEPPAELRVPSWEASALDDARPEAPTEIEPAFHAERDRDIAWAADPPPFDAPAALADEAAEIRPDVPAAGIEEHAQADESARPSAPASAAPAVLEPPSAPAPLRATPRTTPDVVVAPKRKRDRKLGALALSLLGIVLFGAAIILILGGRPGLPSLALGVLGAILIVPGLYGLLAPPRPEARTDASPLV